MAVNLNLTPYDDQDAYIGKLLPISHKAVMDDPAAVVGVDENQNIPPLAENNRVSPQPLTAPPISQDNSDNAMDIDRRNVTMVVLDGVVMGPTVNYLNFILTIIITNLIFIALCN